MLAVNVDRYKRFVQIASKDFKRLAGTLWDPKELLGWAAEGSYNLRYQPTSSPLYRFKASLHDNKDWAARWSPNYGRRKWLWAFTIGWRTFETSRWSLRGMAISWCPAVQGTEISEYHICNRASRESCCRVRGLPMLLQAWSDTFVYARCVYSETYLDCSQSDLAWGAFVWSSQLLAKQLYLGAGHER